MITEVIKNIIGGIALIVGVGIMGGAIFIGGYVTIIWGWVGGAIQVIEAAKLTPVDSIALMWGLLRFLFAGMMGTFIGWIAFLMGLALFKGGLDLTE